MHVTDYELYAVPPRWQFLRLETSDGRVGWGEVYTKWHFAGDSEPATRSAVDQLMHQYVLGEDPSRIEYLWQAMYRSSFYRGGPVHMSAIAGIDEALWDLKGKAAGMPVYELLGGPARDRVDSTSTSGLTAPTTWRIRRPRPPTRRASTSKRATPP